MKKILFVASECVPFIKTGGLADVCGALPKEFDKNYWDVRVVIPDYSCIPEQYRNNFEYVTHFYMSSGPYVHLFKQIIDVYRLGYKVHRSDKPVYVLDTASVNLIFFKKRKSILDM